MAGGGAYWNEPPTWKIHFLKFAIAALDLDSRARDALEKALSRNGDEKLFHY